MPVTRAKFRVTEVRGQAWTPTKARETVVLEAVHGDGTPENDMYANASPQGKVELAIDNPLAWGKLELGKCYYVDFTPAAE